MCFERASCCAAFLALLAISAVGCQFPKNNVANHSDIGDAGQDGSANNSRPPSSMPPSSMPPSTGFSSESSSPVSPANFEGNVDSKSMVDGNSGDRNSGNANEIEMKSPSDKRVNKKQSLAESFLFSPLKYPKGGFSRLDIEGQRVKFTSEDGTAIEGRFFVAAKPKGIILFCHGNAGNLASRTPRMEAIKNRYGYSVFIFDYRGYGRSEGKPTVSGVLADGRAAVKKAAALAHVKESEVIIMGRSLGGAVAIQLASEFQSPKLIVESAFTSFRDIARHHVSFLSALTRKNDLDSVAAIKNYRGAVLFSHATKDKTVPLKHGKKLYEVANQPKQFFEIQNGGHNDPMPESYRQVLGDFLAR